MDQRESPEGCGEVCEEDGGLRDDVPGLSPRHEQLEAETDQVRGDVEAITHVPASIKV